MSAIVELLDAAAGVIEALDDERRERRAAGPGGHRRYRLPAAVERRLRRAIAAAMTAVDEAEGGDPPGDAQGQPAAWRGDRASTANLGGGRS